MEFPKEALSYSEIKESPFCCGCKGHCEHSLILRRDGLGLRLVSKKGWFKAMGIPKAENSMEAMKFLAGAKVKWEDAEMEYEEAA